MDARRRSPIPDLASHERPGVAVIEDPPIPTPWVADVIPPDEARTLDGLLRERVRRTPGGTGYWVHDARRHRWRPWTWQSVAAEVGRWQAGLRREGLKPGDRVAVFMRNRLEWLLCDQAALASGLVVVPIYYNDRAENVAYVLRDAGVRLLWLEDAGQCHALARVMEEPGDLKKVISLASAPADSGLPVTSLDDWLPAEAVNFHSDHGPDDLATIVYTSGTTGRPKGVMLSHRNLLANAHSGLQAIMVYPWDRFLSFLPLSHMLERTVGYYLPMMAGASVAFCRGIPQLAEDLAQVRPSALICVPRIFERSYARIQEQLKARGVAARALFRLAVAVGWQRFEHRHGRARAPVCGFLWPLLDRLAAAPVRARLGGRLRCVISGGAPLPFTVARTFIGLGLPLQQGYGLTEASPVVSVNTFERNEPRSVGPPLPGVEVRVGADDELLVRGENVMRGYWNNHLATYQTIDRDGWLHTGDQARIEDGFVYITGRLKDILVLATGEKLPPADLEMAITGDPLFEQALVVGDGRPFLSAIVVLDRTLWQRLARGLGLDPDDPAALDAEAARKALLERIGERLRPFPGYANVYQVTATLEPWTVDNEMLTPTLKPRRKQILARYAEAVERMYAGHGAGDEGGG